MREAAFKGLVRLILEYGSSVWDPNYESLIHELEKVQTRAAKVPVPLSLRSLEVAIQLS